MLKKLNSFLQDKIKLTVANTTAIYCPKCGSIRVKHFESKITDGKEIINETYYVKCEDCGAYGTISETWEK